MASKKTLVPIWEKVTLTLEEAAAVHGLDPVELELEINDYLAKKEEQAQA